MTIRDKLYSALQFRTFPATIAIVLVYVAVYISVFVTDEVPSVPSTRQQHGVNLTQAYQDLHHVSC